MTDSTNDLAPGSGVERLKNRDIDTRGRTLRQHTARGVLITSAFQVGLAGVGLLRRVLVAAFLTQEEFGLWGLLLSILITLGWLKQVGIADKYIQQSDDDQERAYQKAFTLELAISVAFFLLVAALLPLYAVTYGESDLVVPGLLLATIVPISAFHTPIWIAARRMQFVKQRILIAIDPLVAFTVTIVLGALGYGYWALVIGAVSGAVLGAVAALVTCPYPMRLRFDRTTLNEYTKFSWPLVGLGITNMITVQGSFLVANRTVGLAGVGAIGLASTIASFADRVDGIVSSTIYPAVCTVADRVELLREAFVKSNRVILMWAIPFAVGLALFASDLVTFVLGEEWRSAVGLLVGIGLVIGVSQVGFNWSIFMRAVNDTKPLFLASLVSLGLFAVVMVPALLTLGLDGYVVGLAIATLAQIAVRGYYLDKLFDGFKIVRHSIRAIAPSVPAAGLILLFRLVVDPDRTLAVALGELVVYILATAACTLLFERRLVQEMLGYLRGAVNRGSRARDAATIPQSA